MKSRIYKHLVSYQLVRRGTWLLKVSVFNDKFVMVVAQHYYDADKMIVHQFTDFNRAAEWIDWLVEQENI
jgi:hypothetical protein